MTIKLYADGSDLDEMLMVVDKVSGFTTNPTLMRKAGVSNYMTFAKQVLQKITKHPVSFEVFADDIAGMHSQAEKLASLGENVYVKIPITNTKGESTKDLIHELLDENIKVNVTAVFTREQISEVLRYMDFPCNAILSVFAGRIADTGQDPVPFIQHAMAEAPSNVEVLWASCREVYNVYQAMYVGCHIITVPNSILAKLQLQGKDLEEYSLETVKMFYNDAVRSGFTL